MPRALREKRIWQITCSKCKKIIGAIATKYYNSDEFYCMGCYIEKIKENHA